MLKIVAIYDRLSDPSPPFNDDIPGTTYKTDSRAKDCCMDMRLLPIDNPLIKIIIINLLLIRRKLAFEYDQMRLTTKITPYNGNKIYLRILEINNLKSSQSNNNRQKPS